MSPRLFCVGDLHLGRRPSGLPAETSEREARALGPVAAWRSTVETALAERADLVLLAGDVVEADGDLFEAYGPLEEGVAELAERGIAVAGVAGNHDVEVLPRLARRLSGFRLLGAGGAWERAALDTPGGRVDVHGWSFPERVVTRCPLDGLAPIATGPVPAVGLLHADLDASGGPYAPVPRARLEAAGADAWLLGHVHAPSPLAPPRPLGYLGSVTGLDAGEPGPHGPWWLTLGGELAVTHVPLAPLRWEREAVDVTGIAGGAELDDALLELALAACERVRARVGDAPELRALGVRLVLRGRTRHHRLLRRRLAVQDLARLAHEAGGVLVFVERVVDEAAAELDLERLARGADPPALVARALLALEAGGADELVAEARASLAELLDAPARWGRLPDAAPDVRALLRAAGRTALEELLAQRPDAGLEPGSHAPELGEPAVAELATERDAR